MRGRIPKDEHPLHRAIRLKNKAVRNKAHPKIIAQLEEQIKIHAKEGAEAINRLIAMGLLPNED